MAIEAGLDTLYRAVDILVTEPGEELKKGLTAHGDISQTISAAKDDEKKRLAFKIIDLYRSALRRS